MPSRERCSVNLMDVYWLPDVGVVQQLGGLDRMALAAQPVGHLAATIEALWSADGGQQCRDHLRVLIVRAATDRLARDHARKVLAATWQPCSETETRQIDSTA